MLQEVLDWIEIMLLWEQQPDCCILADDDLVFVDGYVKIVKKVFNDNPNADEDSI